MTDDDELEIALYSRMRWNSPLSPEHAALLAGWLDLRPGLSLTDLGCGWGELLLQLTAAAPGAVATGVDNDAPLLARARRTADERGLAAQVTFTDADAATWTEPADRLICNGASHAFGHTESALAALTPLVPPGGRMLYGDGFWAAPPGDRAVEIFGDGALTLDGLLEAVRRQGWRVIHLSVADQLEWDEFDFSFRAGRQEWLLEHPEHPRAAEIRDWLDNREREYLQTYRGVLGFAFLVLAH